MKVNLIDYDIMNYTTMSDQEILVAVLRIWPGNMKELAAAYYASYKSLSNVKRGVGGLSKALRKALIDYLDINAANFVIDDDVVKTWGEQQEEQQDEQK
jgi:hypothetical protein